MPDEAHAAASVYLETTIISYLTAYPSSLIIVAGNQELTRQWWREERAKYRCFISPYVTAESSRGDSEAAASRLEVLQAIPSLEITPNIRSLARRIVRALEIPASADTDAFHLACAIEYEMDYLLTWNCKHLANGPRLKLLAAIAAAESLWLPIINAHGDGQRKGE
ncbi:MAG: type II toxin-antitoxin system VapC family toxin [Pirellulales bacterium]|nr:type II toxin-antitoxin system VapC family toxin [Pirellulales bacterium]